MNRPITPRKGSHTRRSRPNPTYLKPLAWLVVILIAAIFTYLDFTQSQREKSAPPAAKPNPNTSTTAHQTPAQAVRFPENLGHYDAVMANDKLGQNRTASVDYYMLVLSWSPAFCEAQKQKNAGSVPQHLQYQCHNQAEFGWVIHGLWPQSAEGRTPADHPRFCQGDLAPLPATLIQQYLPESPGAALLQGQWEKHGACAFSDAQSYFAKQKALFRQLNLPAQDLPRKALFQWLKTHNPALRNVRLESRKNELFICYNKQWALMDCPN